MSNINNTVTLDYHTLEQDLEAIEAITGASECHGMVCGQLCRGTPIGAAQWLEHILGRPVGEDRVLAARCAQLLEVVLMSAGGGLINDDFVFEPMLPDDQESLNRRSIALGQWCEGFLYGLALGGEIKQASLSTEAEEVLRDLRDFTRIQGDGGMDEADESSYMEVVEYIRVVVMLLFHEWQQRPAPDTKTVD